MKFSKAFPEKRYEFEEIVQKMANLETASKLDQIAKILMPYSQEVNKKLKLTKGMDRENFIKILKTNGNNNVQAGKDLRCSEGKVRLLKKTLLTEDDLKKLKRKPSRRIRRAKYVELDDLLFKWFLDQRAKSLSVNYNTINKQAKHIAKSLLIDSFKCSPSYIQNFKKRRNLSMRKSTHFMQK